MVHTPMRLPCQRLETLCLPLLLLVLLLLVLLLLLGRMAWPVVAAVPAAGLLGLAASARLQEASVL